MFICIWPEIQFTCIYYEWIQKVVCLFFGGGGYKGYLNFPGSVHGVNLLILIRIYNVSLSLNCPVEVLTSP